MSITSGHSGPKPLSRALACDHRGNSPWRPFSCTWGTLMDARHRNTVRSNSTSLSFHIQTLSLGDTRGTTVLMWTSVILWIENCSDSSSSAIASRTVHSLVWQWASECMKCMCCCVPLIQEVYQCFLCPVFGLGNPTCTYTPWCPWIHKHALLPLQGYTGTNTLPPGHGREQPLYGGYAYGDYIQGYPQAGYLPTAGERRRTKLVFVGSKMLQIWLLSSLSARCSSSPSRSKWEWGPSRRLHPGCGQTVFGLLQGHGGSEEHGSHSPALWTWVSGSAGDGKA